MCVCVGGGGGGEDRNKKSRVNSGHSCRRHIVNIHCTKCTVNIY